MTDYSSNESSNEDDTREEFKFVEDEVFDIPIKTHLESEQPLFSHEFYECNLKKMAESLNSNGSVTNSLTFVPYKDKSLMKSAKKSKKTKRLYIKNKRIPKWAENMEKVGGTVKKQTQSEHNGLLYPEDTYGNICVDGRTWE